MTLSLERRMESKTWLRIQEKKQFMMLTLKNVIIREKYAYHNGKDCCCYWF